MDAGGDDGGGMDGAAPGGDASDRRDAKVATLDASMAPRDGATKDAGAHAIDCNATAASCEDGGDEDAATRASVCSSSLDCSDDGIACNGSERCAPGAPGANAFGCVATPLMCPADQACKEAVGGCACGMVAGCRVGARCDATRDACFGDAPAWPMPSTVRSGLPVSRNYADQGEVVADLVTGLYWQKLDGGRQSDWNAALAYCAGLNLGGASDWRLPTLQEFASLLGPTSSGGATLGLSYYFEFSETGRPAWTASETHGQTGLVWSLGATLDYMQQKTGGLALPARCVRGSGTRTVDTPRFSTAGQSVTDSATGLVWTRSSPVVALASYADNCGSLSQDSASDWRLPEPNEVLSLYDPALGALIAQPFPDLAQPAASDVWVETGAAVGPDAKLSIDTLDLSAAASGNSALLMCVH